MTLNVLAAAARQSLRILFWQAAWTAASALVIALTWGAKAGGSALAGGAIGLVWTVYMALTLFKHSATHGARLGAISFFGGWVVKVVLTICLLVVAFRSSVIAPLPLLGGLVVSMVAYWAGFAFRVRYAGDADGK